jgi:DNA-binding response OmpR family regulator
MPSEAHPILLVSRLPRNLQLLSDLLQKEGYTTVTAGTYDEFDLILSKQEPIAGALVDIAGFNAEIWQRCEQLRAAKVPFLVVSPQQSAAVQKASLSHGARGVMIKPLVVKELIGIVQSLLAG